MERKDELEARVRETPLSERLSDCRKRIGKMCSEGRPPRMCIPVQWDDDDFYISTTLADAQRALDAEREKVKRLEEQLRLANRHQVNTGNDLNNVTAQLAASQAQLRQVEGQSKTQAEEAVIVFAKYTTLRQLVAQLPVADGQEVSVWLSPDESGWLVSKRPAFPAGLYWAKFRTQDEADSFRSLLAYRATLAAGKEDVSHD